MKRQRFHWSGERWFCPDCERILRKAPHGRGEENRYHSWRCRTPLVRAVVEVLEAV